MGKLPATIFRFTNIGVLSSVIVLTLTGVYAFFFVAGSGWIMDLHRIAAWALLALVPWKAGIAWRSLKRGPGRRIDRNAVMVVSLIGATLALTAIVLALLWTWQIGPQVIWFRQLILWWHWILAFALLLPLSIHVWRRWPRPKEQDFWNRRGALRGMSYALAGIAGWWIAEALAERRNVEDTARSSTGSRRVQVYSGNDFPVTSEAAPQVDAETWHLSVTGVVDRSLALDVAGLASRPQTTIEAALDCTNGWWTIQHWSGVLLSDVLDEAGLSAYALAVRITSLTGYTQVFSMKEAETILIATQVGGDPLHHWHGAPARAVVPGRRGWFWVKWIGEIRVLEHVSELIVEPFSIR